MMRSLRVRAKKVCRPPEHELTHKSARRSLSARRPTEPMHQIAWVIWDCQALTMLCATVLAELEAAVPAEKRIIPPCGDVASVDSDASSTDSSAQDTGSSTILASTISASTVSTASDGSNARVGAPRDFSGHADGTSNAYNSVEKWIVAALSKLGQEKADLLLPSLEPNDTLCSQLHSTIAEWHTTRTTARDAGVIDQRPSELQKPPPQECLVKTRGWLLRYINQGVQSWPRGPQSDEIAIFPSRSESRFPPAESCRSVVVSVVSSESVERRARSCSKSMSRAPPVRMCERSPPSCGTMNLRPPEVGGTAHELCRRCSAAAADASLTTATRKFKSVETSAYMHATHVRWHTAGSCGSGARPGRRE